MKGLKKIVVGASIFASLVGGIYLNEQGTISEKKDLIYKGYHVNKIDGYNLLIFDDYKIGEPRLRVIGNPNELKLDEKYNIKVKSPRWIGLNKIDSIKRSD